MPGTILVPVARSTYPVPIEIDIYLYQGIRPNLKFPQFGGRSKEKPSAVLSCFPLPLPTKAAREQDDSEYPGWGRVPGTRVPGYQGPGCIAKQPFPFKVDVTSLEGTSTS
eukprot:295600-Rhodomonas_salina.2